MASSSKYIQITDQILIEYIYTDPLVHMTYNTADQGFEIMTDGYTGTKYLFNADTTNDIGNNRGMSAIPINSSQSEFVYLDVNLPIQYQDFDNNITNTSQLAQTFLPNLDIVYDTIKIHLISGFNYNDLDGYIFNVSVTRKDNRAVNLSSIMWRKNDNANIIMNPKPMLVGEKLYTNYIEYKIPAFNYFADDDIYNSNSLGYKLTTDQGMTKGVGFLKTSTIDFVLNEIYNSYKNNGFTFLKTRTTSSSSVNRKDEFDTLVAVINESVDGDYFELYGQYNGIIFADFINELNSLSNNDYIVFHEYSVYEQVGTEFIQTCNRMDIQTDKFDEPMIFRPVIINSANAVSYSINYTLRLFNKVDNSQILKTSQHISYDTRKYGKILPRINLGMVPTIAKVYNITNDSNYTPSTTLSSSASTSSGLVIKREFVNIFRDRINIKVSVNSIKANQLTTDLTNMVKIEKFNFNTTTFNQGEAMIGLSPFDEFILFNIYKEDSGTDTPLDLTSYGTLFLNFYDNKNVISIRAYDRAADIEPAQGQVVFKIVKEQTRKILGLNNNNFFITSKMVVEDQSSDETVIYNGTFYEFSSYITKLATVKTQTETDYYTNIISSLQDTIVQLNSTITTDDQNLANAVSALQLSEKINSNILDYLENMKAKYGSDKNGVYTDMINLINNIESTYSSSIKNISSSSFVTATENLISDKKIANLVSLNQKQNVTDMNSWTNLNKQ